MVTQQKIYISAVTSTGIDLIEKMAKQLPAYIEHDEQGWFFDASNATAHNYVNEVGAPRNWKIHYPEEFIYPADMTVDPIGTEPNKNLRIVWVSDEDCGKKHKFSTVPLPARVWMHKDHLIYCRWDVETNKSMMALIQEHGWEWGSTSLKAYEDLEAA